MRQNIVRGATTKLSMILQAIALLICLGIPAFVAHTLYQEYSQVLASAETRAANTARALEQHAARTLETIDTYLQTVASLVGPRGGSISPELVHAALHDQWTRLRHLNNFMIIDRDGRSLFEAISFPARTLDVSDREYFQTLRDEPNVGLVVGKPIIGRLTGKLLLPVARRIDNPDGSFAGVIQAILEPAAFQTVYDAIDNGPGATLNLWRSDGTLLVRSPQMPEFIGKSYASGENFKRHVVPRDTKPFWSVGSTDGIEKVIAFGFLDRYPVYVSAALARTDVLAGWQSTAIVQAVVAGGLTFVLVLALLVLARQVKQRQSANARIKSSEARYRLLAENTTDVIIQCAMDTTRLYVSPAAKAVFGYDADELVGTRPLDFVHPDDAEPYRRVLDDLTHERVERVSNQQRYRRKDGSWVWIEVSFSLTRDVETGLATGYIAALRDISDRKAAESAAAESEERYREVRDTAHNAILGQLAEGVIVTDATGRITLVNDAAAAIHGVARLDVEPDGYSDTYHLYTEDGQPYAPQELPLARAVRGETVKDARWRVQRPDHADVLAIGSARPLIGRDGKQVGAVLTMRDDTAREAAERSLRESEAQLRELNATLASRVMERTREADEARAQAEAASQAKSEFLASMSHEIRTPLNGVIGYADLLLDEPSISPIVRKHGERIRNSGAALLTVVNDVLDFSKIEADQVDLDPRPFSPEALIDETMSIARGGAIGKSIAIRSLIDPRLPPLLIGDPDRLRQIFLNLLNNAVKFTSDGYVEIAAEKIGDAEDVVSVRITVTDTGIGIPQDKQAGLFERFAQVDGSISRRFGGTGLGLAISKRLVELMGGSIAVVSQEGLGSTFAVTLRLPLYDSSVEWEASELNPSSTVPEAAHPTRPARILLAEDLAINQDLARAVLERAGHTVDVVSDGAEALQALQLATYDLILMDVQMPVMDGLEATGRIRALPAPLCDVPIIALTANVLSEQVSRFRKAGMDGHVGKPFRRDELLTAVANWLPRADENRQPDRDPTEGEVVQCLDEVILSDISELLGREKTRALLVQLGAQVSERFGPSLRARIERSDLAAEAHAMVSAAGLLGFTDLSDVCRKLETACHTGEDVSGLIEGADIACTDALRKITVLRKHALGEAA